jgi:hypothetical protein
MAEFSINPASVANQQVMRVLLGEILDRITDDVAMCRPEISCGTTPMNHDVLQ